MTNGKVEPSKAELVKLLGDARWRIVNKDVSTPDYQRLDRPVVERLDQAILDLTGGLAVRDWCATMERAKAECGCPDCGSSLCSYTP